MVCEPTGGYERKLLRTARRLGHTTAYVNSEHVAKASVIESGDTGKTDPMDARVISMIAKLDKAQQQWILAGEYLLLREVGQMHDDEEKLLHGLYSSGERFDAARVFTCEGQYAPST